MAELFFARATHGPLVGQRLVVKRLLPHLVESEDVAALFAHEIALAMRLEHPCIVQTLDKGEDDEGIPFLVMPWLDGLDLRALQARLSARRQRMPVGVACAIAAHVAASLDYAHALVDTQGHPLGVVHRDVSPHNVMLTRSGEVKVLDFGIAKTRLTATRTGLVRGKAGYMAPEQLAGLEVDGRADLFSLGVLLWELLSGVRLFQLDTETGTARAVREAPAAPPSAFAPECRGRIDAVVGAMLSKFPSGRPRSAGVVAAALGAEAARFGVVDARRAVATVMADAAALPAASGGQPPHGR
jgi:serine/threonine protein kinase